MDYRAYTELSRLLQDKDSEDRSEFNAIVNEIEKYDVFDFIERVASLNLLIENQNKSLVFDAIIGAILTRNRDLYKSIARMSVGRFNKIIERIERLHLMKMVDPAENPFIERVHYHGNFWIFPGTNYSPGNILQGFLDILYLKSLSWNEDFSRKVRQLINFVLHLSDSIVSSLGYDMETVVSVHRPSIRVPSSSLYEELKRCVRFDYALVEVYISDPSIHELLFAKFSSGNIDQVIKGNMQEFFIHPFLNVGDGTVILLNPTILIPFAIHQIVVWAEEYGIKEKLISEYQNEVWKKCIKDIAYLGHQKILAAHYGIKLYDDEHRKEMIFTAGNDGLLMVHFLCDSGENYTVSSMFERHEIPQRYSTPLQRAKYFLKCLPNTKEESVYHLVIISTFGREVGCEVSDKDSRRTLYVSPAELHCISVNERNEDAFIPRYLRAKSQLYDPTLDTLASELNKIEVYKQHNNSFYISDDCNPRTTYINFGFEFALDYTIRAIKKENCHLLPSYEDIYLKKVFAVDGKRNIYYTEMGKTIPSELVVKFENINIWISGECAKSIEEQSIYNTLTDAISFWMAEAKDIINAMHFNTDVICIKIKLASPVEEYFGRTPESNFIDGIQYYWENNIIHMSWDASAYCLFGTRMSNTEENMMQSIFEELNRISGIPAEKGDVSALFKNPLKKKAFAINAIDEPYMVPTNGNFQTISVCDENELLDSIGAYFLNSGEYGIGRVPDEQRADLANRIVGYLYECLQKEIASISPVGFYEKVCFDLETVMYHATVSQRRFSYDIACYPEKADEIALKHNDSNRTSISLKFLAEYIAAVPPSGEKPLGVLQYDRILAICSQIIDWAYMNDLFRNNIINSPIRFLPSGRIGMDKTESDYLYSVNYAARNRRLIILSDPNYVVYSPAQLIEGLYDDIDEAFEDEHGFTLKQFVRCAAEIADYGGGLSKIVKRFPRTRVIKDISDRLELTSATVEAVIDLITLKKRDDFLKPPAPYKKHDIYPWRFNRELSFTRRPIIQYEDDLIWGSRQIEHMWRYTFDLILQGKYVARKSKLKKLIGVLSNRRGNDFNSAVAQVLSKIKSIIVAEKVSKINGKKITNEKNNTLGDIDVLYIIPEQFKIVVGEVKDFSFAKNPYEMDQEYKKMFVDGPKPCFMTKHKLREQWISEHIDDVKRHFNLQEGEWSVHRVMFVSEEIISNSAYHKDEKIIVYSEISEDNVLSI